jgi:hypothetical protein
MADSFSLCGFWSDEDFVKSKDGRNDRGRDNPDAPKKRSNMRSTFDMNLTSG